MLRTIPPISTASTASSDSDDLKPTTSDSDDLKPTNSPFGLSPRLSLFERNFQKKNNSGEFLGGTSLQRESLQSSQFTQTASMARTQFAFKEKGAMVHGEPKQTIESSPHAISRTKQAASAFFSLAYQYLDTHGKQFPLAGKNKCLGMVAVPNKKLVMLAISQDKNPAKDETLRRDMVQLLDDLNLISTDWVFELACIPTKSQYMMPRTLFMRTIHPAPEEWVRPHTRCVEVALMVALNKIGRYVDFSPEDAGVMAFGGTMWMTNNEANAIPHFEGAKRNRKYTSQDPITVDLGDGLHGEIDIWDPCGGHCAIYKDRMLAIGASGGPATSFIEPRSERNMARLVTML